MYSGKWHDITVQRTVLALNTLHTVQQQSICWIQLLNICLETKTGTSLNSHRSSTLTTGIKPSVQHQFENCCSLASCTATSPTYWTSESNYWTLKPPQCMYTNRKMNKNATEHRHYRYICCYTMRISSKQIQLTAQKLHISEWTDMVWCNTTIGKDRLNAVL